MKKEKSIPKLIYTATKTLPTELGPAVYYAMPNGFIYRIALMDVKMFISNPGIVYWFTCVSEYTYAYDDERFESNEPIEVLNGEVTLSRMETTFGVYCKDLRNVPRVLAAYEKWLDKIYAEENS